MHKERKCNNVISNKILRKDRKEYSEIVKVEYEEKLRRRLFVEKVKM